MNAKLGKPSSPVRHLGRICLVAAFILPLLLTGCSFDAFEWFTGKVQSDRNRTAGVAPTGEAPAPEDEGPDPAADVLLPCTPFAGTDPADEAFPAVTVQPADESGKDASFSQFRTELLDRIAARDSDGLLALVDPAIRTSFGEGGGIEDFQDQWGLNGEEAARSPLWNVLEDIFRLGGVFEDPERTRFTAPYVFARFPGESLDPFSHAVVTGSGVNVRTGPSLDASVIQAVSHLVVRLVGDGTGPLPTLELEGRTYCWRQVQLPTLEAGYVADRYLWSPVGYRALFGKTPEGWRLQALLAGD